MPPRINIGPPPLCVWCKVRPVKTRKTPDRRQWCETCSYSCAASLKWHRMGEDGRLIRVQNGQKAAAKSQRLKRVVAEAKKQAAECGLVLSKEAMSFFLKARNRGYLNGYAAGIKRERARQAGNL